MLRETDGEIAGDIPTANQNNVMRRDRISELPDDLIAQILVRLPIRDSIRTSVLSKRWEFLWLKVPVLDLNAFDFSRLVLASIMGRFLESNQRSCLQKFKIKYVDDLELRHTLVDRYTDWVIRIIDLGIQHLEIEKPMYPFVLKKLPMDVYNSKTLVSLKLANVWYRNPERDVSLPSLKILHLEDPYFDGGDNGPLIVDKLIAGCPVLEDLTVVRDCVHYLKSLPLLRVRSRTLKMFRLVCQWSVVNANYAVEIDAPRLECLSFGDGQSERITVKNLSSLVKIDLDSVFNVCLFGSRLLQREDAAKSDSIRDFLTGVSTVRHMIISQPTVEVIYRHFRLGLIPIFHNLNRLQAAFSSSELQLFPTFLESCPVLKNLILDYSVSEECVAEEPELFELTYVPRCLTSTLEYVEIKELIMEEETGIILVDYLLENSAVLKKLTLRLADSPMMTNQDSEMYRKLITSTKLSRSCEVSVY
ncbi:unnamed protein product [Microthlaspi erraticum]|uniref:F-box domain-containing protein n=1 Tax=Microthlaspi erraticum TaxID=1685480 RepID=A0A6D2I8D2_9BRAS|nr:unnamed protein product [Microthlaspi erraticum]